MSDFFEDAPTPPAPDLDPCLVSADLPFVLYTEDIARIFRKSVSAARDGIRRHEYGPYFVEGRRLALLRDSMIEHLREKQVPAQGSSPRRRRSAKARGYAERLARKVRGRKER